MSVYGEVVNSDQRDFGRSDGEVSSNEFCCIKLIDITATWKFELFKKGHPEEPESFWKATFEVGDTLKIQEEIKACAKAWCSSVFCEGEGPNTSDSMGEVWTGDCDDMVDNMNSNRSWWTLGYDQAEQEDHENIFRQKNIISAKRDGCCSAVYQPRTNQGPCIEEKNSYEILITAEVLRDIANEVTSTGSDGNSYKLPAQDGVIHQMMDNARNTYGIGGAKQPKPLPKCPPPFTPNPDK